MKRTGILVLVALCLNLLAQADDSRTFDCAGDNGHLLVTVWPNVTTVVGVTVVNAFGGNEGVGQLACAGPRESAYRCEGLLNAPVAGGPISELLLSLFVPELIFQGYGGAILSEGNRYLCRLADF